MVWDVPPSRAQAVTLNYPPAAAPIHRCARCNHSLTFLSRVYPESPAGGQSGTAVCRRAVERQPGCQKYLPDKLELDGGSLIWCCEKESWKRNLAKFYWINKPTQLCVDSDIIRCKVQEAQNNLSLKSILLCDITKGWFREQIVLKHTFWK